MPLDPRSLRKWFAAGAVLAILVAAGFYLRSAVSSLRRPVEAPKEMPKGVERTAAVFSFSQSDGGRTLFKISAASVQQFKEGERYELHDASIILYGREGDRSDQIRGADFQYDKNTGDVTAKGEVEIDLAANSPVAGPQDSKAPQITESMVHLKTSGLTFNEKTGRAQTRERIEFRIPEANGSAVGAIYDSHAKSMVLKSAVKIATTGRQKANITGETATILQDPQRIIVQGARIEQPPRVLTAGQLTVMLRPNNSVDHVFGTGGIRALREGPDGSEISAPQGELALDNASQLKSGVLSGGVSLVRRGESPAEGKVGRMLLSFGAKGRLEKVRAQDAVEFKQEGADKSQQIIASALDVFLRDGKVVEKAVTDSGPAQIVLTEKQTKSTISASQFEARFGEKNRLKSVFGSPGATIVSSTTGQPDRVTTSHDVTATFNNNGQIASAEQAGDFRFQEGDRKAWAERARYSPATETYVLTGSPRVQDSDVTLTSESIELGRKTASAVAQGNVKTTYNQKAQAGGAMLSSADPVHVTGASMTANRSTGVARYTAARLWRGADIVEAPTILFDHTHRSLQALKDASARVAAVFVQPEKNGKTTPVNVTADKLTYVDNERKAVFSGNVLVRIEGATITANTVDALLNARGGASGTQGGSQLDRIVALGDIQIQQPDRKATGNLLVYTGADEKFVLTGSAGHPPSIFDAERGQISGDSLTFFTHDGRVLVGSGESSLIQTQSKAQDASKK